MLIFFSVVFAVLFYGSSQRIFSLGLPIQAVSNGLGALSVAAGSAAIGIWVARKLYIEIKKRKIPDFQLTRTALLFLRRHHILLGWTTLLVATSHGIYYLMNYPNRAVNIFTGLFAWLMLALLVSLGSWLDYKLKAKQKMKKVRLYHMAIAFIFIAGMVIHIL